MPRCLHGASTCQASIPLPGTTAKREVRKYQEHCAMLIPRAPFQRLVRSIVNTFKTGIRFRSSALAALQEGTEAFLVSVL